MDPAILDEAVRGGEIDELLRLVDACCSGRDWAALASLRGRCERAYETGHQLWPVASHAAYRLAREAPAPFAAAVLVEGAGRFAPGPLPEVAAQRHTWAELAPEVPPGAPAMYAAHERVLRGEDLTNLTLDGPAVLEVPLRLADWEPEYALAEYRDHDADFPAPPVPMMETVALPAPGEPHPLDDAAVALRDTVRVWADDSNGEIEVVAIDGDVTVAIATVRTARDASPDTRIASVTPDVAFAHLAWAGASGGAHGRRPGAASGRFAAWWAGAALGGLLDDWPPEAPRLGDRLAALRWALWDDTSQPATGWRLQLAVEDPASGRAWAIRATDHRSILTDPGPRTPGSVTRTEQERGT
jgi:hypothetical protein